uniref:Uncharacterized protein n=1 Tax=Globodera rostochiensis TaxID=31243 RepID=A0A914I4C4_GLORO
MLRSNLISKTVTLQQTSMRTANVVATANFWCSINIFDLCAFLLNSWANGSRPRRRTSTKSNCAKQQQPMHVSDGEKNKQ